ncbi:anti-sigma B factor antagonist [Cellulosimicrobium cellulans]|uniref:STAS domain-containing protein n=1 Tax=Cellulosimicrobium cellulans TaxID=1710 RepID=UPI0027DC31F9|nr:STAS domain-containing protein [Cellulosimicrobium cellulans]MBM7818723.1 anti-sigma B factor antagonist [Cellulosimicrobium cellulans]
MTPTTSGDVLTTSGGTRWTMRGEIDAAVQARREDELLRIAQSANERIHVDLGEVTFMDSGGLRLLYHAATAGSGAPVLERVPRRVRDLLELSGVVDLFEFADDTTGEGGA